MDTRICGFPIISSRCHVRLERYDEALELCRESLPIGEALGDPLVKANILDLIGYILAMKNQYEGGLLVYSQAITEYSNMDTTFTSTNGLARCNHNISQIDQANEGEGRVILEAL